MFHVEHMGRHSEYSEETAGTICARLAQGDPLVKICREDEFPDVSTVYRWLISNDSFREMYARAREDQADTLADQIIDIADTCKKGVKTTTKANGDIETTEGDMVERSRLQMEARKWVAAKLKPRKYGDKLDVAHTGDVTVNCVNYANPNNPV